MRAELTFAPGYTVSDDGIVRNKRGKALKQWVDERGRKRVQVAGKPRMVHLLVLQSFAGPRQEGAFPRWLNGNPQDNRLVNLKWQMPDDDLKPTAVSRCRNGHAYTRENTVTWGAGKHRVCLPCRNGEAPVLELPEVLR